jgi:cellulose synthase/poly-beta-1,6-N-acetylglucosamine synthase-like glycosyltransferase
MVASPSPATETAWSPRGRRSSHGSAREASTRSPERSDRLPDEIAFLATYGIPLAHLTKAAALARRTAVSPAAALLAGGEVTDTTYYSLLARRLGAPFVSSPFAFLTGDGKPLHPGAPIVGPDKAGRFLTAPEGGSLRELLIMWREGRAPVDRLAITTPRRLASGTRAATARAVARSACDELRRFDPRLSAAPPLAYATRAAWLAIAAIAIIAACADGYAWLVLCAFVGLVAGASIFIRVLAAASTIGKPSRSDPIIPDDLLPTYTIIIPLYREAGVIARLTRGIDALDYPPAKIEVKLVVEADDQETRSAIEALALPDRYEMIIAPHGVPRTKPRALNVALATARGALIVVFDAEDAPERDQLRLAAERFAAAGERLACLQARLAIDNTADGWLAALFGIEYAALFDVLNPGLAATGAPMMLGGTSNHFRASALRRLRGWDAWNVTEDADLGLRLARFGFRVETIDATTHEEAPARLAAWLNQRRRWIKGWMQTMIVHSRDPARLLRELGVRQAAVAMALLANGVFGPLLAPVFAVLLATDAIWGDLLSPTTVGQLVMSTIWTSLALAGLGSSLWMFILGIRRRGLEREARWLVMLPAYHLLLTVAAWGALIELFRDPYHWSKTSHGHAKTSRRGAQAECLPQTWRRGGGDR